MKRMVFLVFVSLCFQSVAIANQNDLNDEEAIYYVPSERILPGYSADLISKGLLLGKVGKLSTPVPSVEGEENVGKIISTFRKFEKDSHNELNLVSRAKRVRFFQRKYLSRGSNSELIISSPEKKVVPVFDLELLVGCAQSTLANYKIILSADESSPAYNIAENYMTLERAKKGELNAGGIVCGKYMGRWATNRIDKKSELKLIYSISSMKKKIPDNVVLKEQIKNLLKIHSATYDLNSPVMNNGMWLYIWRTATLNASFEKSIDLNPTKLAGQFKTGFKDVYIANRNVRIKLAVELTEDELQEILDKGLDYVKES